jgi:hypothetical protein
MTVNKETLSCSLESFISLLISGKYVPNEHNYSSEDRPSNFDPGDQELSNGTVPDRKSHLYET